MTGPGPVAPASRDDGRRMMKSNTDGHGQPRMGTDKIQRRRHFCIFPAAFRYGAVACGADPRPSAAVRVRPCRSKSEVAPQADGPGPERSLA